MITALKGRGDMARFVKVSDMDECIGGNSHWLRCNRAIEGKLHTLDGEQYVSWTTAQKMINHNWPYCREARDRNLDWVFERCIER